jgi:ABC-type phosphate/phosphonate transport system permease subunit
VRLQAAARGLLARRRLHEMQQIEQPAIAVMEMTRTCPRAAVVHLPVAVRGLLAR